MIIWIYIINWMQRDITIILYTNILKVLHIIRINGIKDTDMSNNEIIELLRGYDIPDCKKYKELLESEDKEVIRLAIELLIVDEIDEYQIRRCREKFLGEVYLGDSLIGQMTTNESKYYENLISIVI